MKSRTPARRDVDLGRFFPLVVVRLPGSLAAVVAGLLIALVGFGASLDALDDKRDLHK